MKYLAIITQPPTQTLLGTAGSKTVLKEYDIDAVVHGDKTEDEAVKRAQNEPEARYIGSVVRVVAEEHVKTVEHQSTWA